MRRSVRHVGGGSCCNMKEADERPATAKKEKTTKAYGNSELFTVRLWMEELDERRREFRGQVKHVVSGATRNFRDWSDLEAFLIGTLEEHKEGIRGQDDSR